MRKKKFKLDKTLLLFLVVFCIISIITIYSASTYLPAYLGNLPFKQTLWYLGGFFVIFIVLKLGYQKILKYAWHFYLFGIILLILLFPFGTTVNNSTCWFNIPGIGSIQPSEFMKTALILVLAKITGSFWKERKVPSAREEILYLLQVFGIVLVPSILTFLQPDTGAVLIYLVITLAILLVSGIRARWFIFGAIAFFSIVFLFFYFYYYQRDLFIETLGTDIFYRIDRLLDWKRGDGYQLENALTAIGSSGLFGHGWNHTPLYFPESGTDFIFAVFASNFGLIGSTIFIILIMLFDFYLFTIMKKENNKITIYLLAGLIGVLIYQQIQNIGMTLGMLPITGITLPFISYGGSSLLSYFVLIGLIFSIQNETKKKSRFL